MPATKAASPGPRVAAILSIVETCRRLKVPVRDYLASVLPGLLNFPINRVAELNRVGGRQKLIAKIQTNVLPVQLV